VIAASGLLCLVSLGHGRGMLGRLVSSIWKQIHTLSLWIVGGAVPSS
jgi:hypothetical protein